MSEQMHAGQRVAFFGGSFDPPHMGHLAVAHAALSALSLDAVLFAPVGTQPLKPSGSSAGFQDRTAMTKLAIANEPAFRLSLADAPRADGKPNYTLETLISVKGALAPDSVLYCLMGADSFAGLRRWFRSAEIPFVAPLVVASRPGEPLGDLESLLPTGLSLEKRCDSRQAKSRDANTLIEMLCYSLVNSEGLRAPFYLLPNLDIPISASQIREWMREPAGRACQALLPAEVAEYIRTGGLYR